MRTMMEQTKIDIENVKQIVNERVPDSVVAVLCLAIVLFFFVAPWLMSE